MGFVLGCATIKALRDAMLQKAILCIKAHLIICVQCCVVPVAACSHDALFSRCTVRATREACKTYAFHLMLIPSLFW